MPIVECVVCGSQYVPTLDEWYEFNHSGHRLSEHQWICSDECWDLWWVEFVSEDVELAVC